MNARTNGQTMRISVNSYGNHEFLHCTAEALNVWLEKHSQRKEPGVEVWLVTKQNEFTSIPENAFGKS